MFYVLRSVNIDACEVPRAVEDAVIVVLGCFAGRRCRVAASQTLMVCGRAFQSLRKGWAGLGGVLGLNCWP